MMAIVEVPAARGGEGALRPDARRDPAPIDVEAARWQRGDDSALAWAFERWGAPIYSYCLRRLPASDAADATQDVFVAAWRGRSTYDPARGTVVQWLFGIARNVCAGRARRTIPIPVDSALAPPVAVESHHDDHLADRLLLTEALRALPERQRQVLVRCFVEGRTNVEAAELLALPLGTVKSDIRRGLRALRHRLEGTHG